MTKQVVFKVGDFVTPIETGNTIGVIHNLNDDTKTLSKKKRAPIKVLYLDFDGRPTGSWDHYENLELIKTPRKYRAHFLQTGKSVIKDFEAC